MSQQPSDHARDPRLQQVLDRTATDPEFRRRVLASPHAAVREAFGYDIPASFRVKFIERDPLTDALIVLPPLVASSTGADGELDDAALESVAGGVSYSESATNVQAANSGPGWGGWG